MFNNVDDYLKQLKKELRDSDSALIQDALFDAEEHLRNALDSVLEESKGLSESEALQPIIEKYGSPDEVASAYKEIEIRITPVLAPSRRQESLSCWKRFFGAISDPRTWGALFYMILALLTGCIYGMWILFGASFSLFTLILIIGLPITGLFLLSVRGLALMEGRIVEVLLGVRMPNKPLFIQKGLDWKAKFKALITEAQTWKALFYLSLRFPLGFVYGIASLLLLGLSVKFTFYPLWYWFLGRPLITLGQPYFPPVWTFPFICAGGFLLFFLTLHLTRFLGKMHGRFARAMLVRK
jgi:hypothetical protein